MSIRHIPDPDQSDYHTDLQWRRQERARQSLRISDVLAEVDSLITQEPDPAQHPLFSLVANALDRRVMAGTGEALQQRFARLIDHAIERLVEQQLADRSCWEVD